MQPFNSLDIALYIALAFLFALALIWWVYALGRSHGHDGGYNDGVSAGRADQQERIEALHEDLANLHGKLADIDTANRLDRDAIIQDADARIAIYSRRANPMTREDAKWLRKVAGQLQMLANMHHNLGAETAENWALAAVAKANNLAALVDEALDAAEDEAPTDTDTQLLDWLDKNAYLNTFIEDDTVAIVLHEPLPAPHSFSIRETITRARALHIAQAPMRGAAA